MRHVQSVINSISNVEVWANGATGLLNANSLNSLKTAVSGLSKEQALLVLSTKNLTQAQKEQVLIEAGIIASNDKINASIVQRALAESTLTAEQQKDILTKLELINVETGEVITTNACTKAALEEALAKKGIVGADAEAIISSMGLTSANTTQTISFDLLTASIWANIKALGKWLVTNPIGWAILGGTAIFGLVKAYDALTDSTEEVKERTDALLDSYNSAISEANSNAKTIESLASRYEALSKGVNNLGENVSLTADEYSEYNDIVNQIAEMFPTMITGYTDEGNAILSLKGNVEELRDAYKEAQKEAYNLLIVSGKDSDGNDIITNYQNQLYGNESFLSTTSSYIDGEAGAKDAIDVITRLTGALTPDEFRETYNQLYEEYENVWNSDKIQDALKSSGFEELTHAPKWSEITTEDLANVKYSAQATIQTYQAEIDSQLQNVRTLANAYLMTNSDYEKLDEQSKTAASLLVNSIDESIANGFENKSDVGAYVAELITSISNNAEAQKALTKLFTIDTTDMSVGEIQSDVDSYISIIADAIHEDSDKLKVRLGFEDVDTQTLINNVKGKLKGTEFDDKVGELSLGDLKIASELDVPLDSIESWEELLKLIEEVKTQNPDEITVLSSIDDYKASITSLTTSYEALNNVLSEQNSQNYITAESYNALIEANSNFADALEYGSGYMRINSEKAIELAEADAKLALAELEVKEAFEVEQYNKNYKEIQKLDDSVTTLTETELEHLEQLKAENTEIENNIQQYDLLESQLEQTLSGYNRFRQAMETPNSDDAYINIISDLETLQELYDKNLIGYDEFKAGMSAYMGESATLDDFTDSMKVLNKYFTESQSGMDAFMKDLVTVGELQLGDNGNITGTLDWESAKKSLAEYLGVVEITDDVMQALVGRAEAYGAVISTENGVDGVEDLTEAQNELTVAIEDYNKAIEEKKKLGLDTSAEEEKIKALETQLEATTQEIEEFKNDVADTEVDATVKFDLDAELAKLDTSNLSTEAQSTLNKLNATNAQIKLNAQMGVDTTYLEGQAKTQLNLLKEQMNIPVEVSDEDASKTIDNLSISAENATTAINDTNTAALTLSRTSIGDLGLYATKIKAQGLQTDIRSIGTELDNLNGKSISIKVNTNGGESGDGKLLGTTGGFAHVLGTAFANGSDIGAKQSSLALTGELGRELVVRGNRWFTVGDNGAEFAHIKKGDIVFNAEQTRQLLEGSGHINSRGYAFASGTAYNKTGINYKIGDSSSTSKKSKTTKDSSTGNSKDESKTLIDWIARRLDVLQTKAERWAKIIENATDSTKITKYYNKLESVYKKQVKTTYDAASRYLSKANSIKLSSSLKKKVQSKDSSLFTKDGNLKSYKTLIKQYGEKTAEAISNYQDYYDKYQSAIDSYMEACENLYNAPLEEASAKIELLAKSLDLLDAKLDNTSIDNYKDANALIDEQVVNQKDKEKANESAYKTAKKNFNSAKKPFDVDSEKDLKKYSDLTKKERKEVLKAVKDGQEIDLTLFKEGSKGYKKALAYNTALQARNDAEQEYQLAVQETVKIEREAEKQKFDNIQTYYEKRISLYDHNMQNLDNRISEIESSGANVNKSYYESQKKINNDIKKMYEEEKTKLEEQLSSIAQGTEEWYEAKDEIQECENAISDCVKTTYELNNAIKDLHFQMFEDISDEIQRIINEQEFLQSLFEHEDSVSTETGNFTDAGIARLGSISTQYYATEEDNTNNSAILNELNRMIKSGEKYSKLLEFEFTSTDDLIDKRNEYIDIVQDGYKQQYDYATKLADLEKEKYQAELDMLRDLIDKKLEAIDAEKD